MGRDKITPHHLVVLEEDVQQPHHLTEGLVDHRILFLAAVELLELPQQLVMEVTEELFQCAQSHHL
jgi:hypothetical protein